MTCHRVQAHAHEIAFVLKVLPMLPSGVVDRLTAKPVIEKVRYPAATGEMTADLYRPPGKERHPAIVLSLGVVPFGVDHPQVPRLGEALARAGFVALMHWSPAMRDFRLVPEDAEDIARAYSWLLTRDDVDLARSGLYGTCVGGSFALLAAAQPAIHDRVSFVGAFAPFSSMWTLARDILGETTDDGRGVRPWDADQLTRQVFRQTMEGLLSAEQARTLMEAHDRASAEAALQALPAEARARLDAMSPIGHLPDIHAPCLVLGHDRDDLVIPIAESRRLARALAGRRGVRYTEYRMFQHADPTKRHLSPVALTRELVRFYMSLQPLFSQTAI
jgi:dienelactone hydrolase